MAHLWNDLEVKRERPGQVIKAVRDSLKRATILYRGQALISNDIECARWINEAEEALEAFDGICPVNATEFPNIDSRPTRERLAGVG